MKLFMHSKVILSGKLFWAMGTSEFVITLMCSLMSPQTVAPLEGLSALSAHIFAFTGVGVHMGG